MIFFLITILLLIFMLAYIKWAVKVGVVDLPNDRSSHTRPTIRGGGIIFPAAILMWGVFFDHSSWPFIIAVLLAGGIGFMDDRYNLSQLPRLIVQSIAVLLILWEVSLMTESIWFILIGFVLVTGWLNAFNFMDGINGISVFYAVAVIAGIYLFIDYIPQIELSLIYVVMISLIIFAWFNARTRAVAFAGDVGSLSLGLILAYLVTTLILETGRWEFILFLSVYGVDTVMTILHRLTKRENIFEAHRSHLYQYLANEMGWHHLAVSAIYALTQFGIILGLYLIESSLWPIYSMSVLASLGLIYIIGKAVVIRRLGSY